MKSKTYKIKLFTNAMGPAREKSRFTYLNFYGEKVNIPYIVWYIEGGDKKILVDAGCGAEDYYRIIKGESEESFKAGGESFKDVQDVCSFEDGLKKWGLVPEDIDLVIMTHLHWDHIMGVEKCKNAKILVQEEEWKGALNPHPIMDFAYAPRWYYENMRNLEFVNGDVDLMPGIRLIYAPGHTPGGQTVAVDTEEGTFAITGYCALKDNFYPPKEVQEAIGYPVIPIAVHTDSLAVYEANLKLLNMFGNKILPAHAEELMEIEEIPAQWTGF